MEHNIPLITTIASGFGLALVFGFIAERFKIPALVGYLLAGIIIGPGTPGFVADVNTAAELSEIGVMLLMFGVGLHFSLDDLMSVKRIAIPGAVLQMSVATLLGMGLGLWWGWSIGAALVFGVSLSCASTVVLIKALESIGALETMDGRIAVGWLVMEDLATVLVLVLLPPLAGVLSGDTGGAGNTEIWWAIGKTLLQVSAFVAIMIFAGGRALPWLMLQVARTGSRELFTLLVVTSAIGIAYAAGKLFGVSFALGAFFAGTVMRSSEFSHRAAEESLPLRDAFSVLFFVSVGMLFDPSILIEQPIHVLGTVAVIVIGKTLAAMALVVLFRYPLNTVLTISASLAQIGEFSFILAGLGVSLGLLGKEGQSLVLAGALISITLNPLLFAAIPKLRAFMVKRFAFARRLEEQEDRFAELPISTDHKYLSGQVVLVGYGRIGRHIAKQLDAQNIPYVVIDLNRERVEDLRKEGIVAVSGNATDSAVIIQAHIAEAKLLLISTPDVVSIRKICEIAHTLNPELEIVLRTHTHEESRLLETDGLRGVFFSEEDFADDMAKHVLQRFA